MRDAWARPLSFDRDFEVLGGAAFDFVYDRKTGLIFRSLASQHGATMAILYQIHTGTLRPDLVLMDDSDQGMLYLEQGFGAYKSSMDAQRKRQRLRCSERFESTMTPTEIEAFSQYELQRP